MLNSSFLRDQASYKYKYIQPGTHSNPLLINPPAHLVKGSIRIGKIKNSPAIFGLLPEEVSQHLLIYGRSGSGKTNLNRIIQLELFRNNIPFLTFDLIKYGSRYTKKHIPNLMIIRWKNEFYANLLKPPPGVNQDEWLMTFCEIFSEAFGLFAASKSLLIEVMKNLYTEFDQGKYPTLSDLHQALGKRRNWAKSKFQRVDLDYIDRVRNKTLAIIMTLKNQLNVEEGIPLEELLNHNVCLEFIGINSSEIQTWLVSIIMAWIASYRTANMHYGSLRHVIFYDEASHVFGKNNGNENYLMSCIRRLRESGEGLVLSDQSIASLHDVLKSNIYTLICLSQSGSKDIKEASENIGMVPPALEPGQGIIKMAGRYTNPSLLIFPYVLPQYITEEEMEELNQKDEELQTILKSVKFKSIPEHQEEYAKSPEKDVLDNKVKEWLIAVYHHQYKKTITEIANLIGLPNSTCSRLNKKAISKNLVQIIQIGKSRYPVLKPESYKEIGLEERKYYGKGAGHEHVLYQHLIAEKFKEYKPIIELYRGGKHIDVAIEIKERLLAIEVEMTDEHVIENITKDIKKAKADFIIVACKDNKVLKEANLNLLSISHEVRKKTGIILLSKLLDMEAKEIIDMAFSNDS